MGIMLIQQIIYVWRYAHITILMTHMVTNILAIVYSAATYPILLLQTLIPVKDPTTMKCVSSCPNAPPVRYFSDNVTMTCVQSCSI
jgi:hypothetical protein